MPIHVAFVIPFAFETSVRFLRAALGLEGVRVGVISGDPLERLGPEIARQLHGHWRVVDPFDPKQLIAGVEGLERQLGGPIVRVEGVLEQLQVPLAVARQRLGLQGLTPNAALNFRDKARMKDVLRKAGVPCARHELIETPAAAKAFVARVGFPIVIKPQAGAGAENTHRLNRAEELTQALRAFPPSVRRPVLFEEFMTGEERSFDAVCVDGRMVWASVSLYHPTPLEVMENAWLQWSVLLPRDVSGEDYAPIRAAGATALSALGLRTGLCHMEWFRRPDGSVAVSEVAARPPGAQITSLLSYVYDRDMYRAWGQLVFTGTFQPSEREYAAGAVYFRGQGLGERVVGIRGLEQAQREVGEHVVEVKLPRLGQRRSSSYEGEGYAIVRHRDTGVVADALRRIAQRVRVELG